MYVHKIYLSKFSHLSQYSVYVRHHLKAVVRLLSTCTNGNLWYHSSLTSLPSTVIGLLDRFLKAICNTARSYIQWERNHHEATSHYALWNLNNIGQGQRNYIKKVSRLQKLPVMFFRNYIHVCEAKDEKQPHLSWNIHVKHMHVPRWCWFFHQRTCDLSSAPHLEHEPIKKNSQVHVHAYVYQHEHVYIHVYYLMECLTLYAYAHCTKN